MRYLVGIGNYTMGDDGIGLRLVEHVAAQGLNAAKGAHPGFEVLDIADNGMNLLSYFNEETEKMLWVDCIFCGRKPGEWVLFSPDDVDTQKKLARMTTHEGDMLQVLQLARLAGYRIPPIRIMGIEPESVSQGLELSKTLSDRFPAYVQAAIDEVRSSEW